MTPQISIILPTFNGEKYITESIKSCLDQSFSDFELIIVNDCSSDNTLSIIESFLESDSRIRIINNQKNLQLPGSLNIGFQSARGKYFTWTSDDNIFKKNALEVLIDSITKNNSPDIVYSSYNIIDEKGSFISKYGGNPEELIFQNIIGACFLFKKNVFVQLSGYDEMKYTVEDYDFWLRALKYFNFKYIDEVLYSYRRHDKSISNEIYQNTTVYNQFIELHKKTFKEFYKNVLGIIFSDEEAMTLTMIYLNNNLKDNYEFTIEHYKNCCNLIEKLKEIDWEKINFDPNRIKLILDSKKFSFTEVYIQDLFFWKNQFMECKFCFRIKYINPLFWLRKSKEYFSS
jgi:glycosyltransferase involved in cell wall biosynthesis